MLVVYGLDNITLYRARLKHVYDRMVLSSVLNDPVGRRRGSDAERVKMAREVGLASAAGRGRRRGFL